MLKLETITKSKSHAKLPFRNEDLHEFKKLADFNADTILEITASLINIIKAPEVPFKSVTAPVAMSARYKMGSIISEAIKNLGFSSNEIGYQTFIYCQEQELRSVFMFLIEQLPKETSTEDYADEDPKAEQREKVAKSIDKEQSKEDIEKQSAFSSWDVEDMKDEDLFRLLPKETRMAAIEAKIKLNSLIQQNESLKLSELSEIPGDRIEKKLEIVDDDVPDINAKEDQGQVLVSRSEPVEVEKEVIVKDSSSKPSVPSQDSKLEALKLRKSEMEQELEEMHRNYKLDYKKLKSMKLELKKQEENQLTLTQELQVKQKEVEKREKILKLLPSGEENLQKLKDMVSKKKQKLRGLQDQFELHKASIIEDREKMEKEIQKLKLAQSQNVLNKEMTTKDHIKWTEDELERQKELGRKLAKQVEKIPTDFVPRSEYTSQIMDILNNVAKQKNETKKVIEEIRTVQKDINMQEGKLSRTYADADYLLFEVSSVR